MARLGTRVCPMFTDQSLTNLRSRKIYTFVQFLREDPEKLVKICQLSYPDIMLIRMNIISHYSAFPKNGLDTYNELLTHSALLPTGIKCLDNILDGGLLTGTLTELCGVPSSGKSQLCFRMLVNAAVQFNQQVHYIDTKGGFSGKRLNSILEERGISSEEKDQALRRIAVTSVNSINELLSFLYHIRGLNPDSADGPSSRLIILDSLPALFYQFIGTSSNHGLGLMNNLATLLKYIAVENRVAIVLVNLAVKGIDCDDTATDVCLKNATPPNLLMNSMRPALGKYWFHVPNLRLYLRRDIGSNEVDILVAKSSSIQLGKHCRFSLS